MYRGPEQIMRMEVQQGGQAGAITASGQQVLKQLLEDGPGDHVFLLRLFKVSASPPACKKAFCDCVIILSISLFKSSPAWPSGFMMLVGNAFHFPSSLFSRMHVLFWPFCWQATWSIERQHLSAVANLMLHDLVRISILLITAELTGYRTQACSLAA